MTPLQEFLVEARSAGMNCRTPASRRAGAYSARQWKQKGTPAMSPALLGLVDAIADLMIALPLIESGDAIVKTGDAIVGLVDASRAIIPPPAPKKPRADRKNSDQPAGWWTGRD